MKKRDSSDLTKYIPIIVFSALLLLSGITQCQYELQRNKNTEIERILQEGKLYKQIKGNF